MTRVGSQRRTRITTCCAPIVRVLWRWPVAVSTAGGVVSIVKKGKAHRLSVHGRGTNSITQIQRKPDVLTASPLPESSGSR